MKLPADTLGLSKMVLPPYAMKVSDLWLLPPAWQSFRESVGAERDKYKAKATALAKQTPWLADATLRGPLTEKAVRLSQHDGGEWTRRHEIAYGNYTKAIRFEQQQRKALEDRLAGIHEDGKKQYRSVAGGYQYDDVCPQIRAAVEQYLAASGKRLDASSKV